MGPAPPLDTIPLQGNVPVLTKQSLSVNIPEGGNVFDLISEHDPRLRYESEDYNFQDYTQDETNQLVLDLGASMRKYSGIGLSACQVGIMKKVFVIETGEELPLAIFNPIIVDSSEETSVLTEGCLSWPDVLVDIKRAKTIRIRFQNFNREWITANFSDLSAHVVQHEEAHCRGLTMKDMVSKLKWEQALSKRKKRVR